MDTHVQRPNDILVKGKKIWGILVETASKAGWVESAVIGIGLNVNAANKELIEEATSMLEILGKKTSCRKILHEILNQLKKDIGKKGTGHYKMYQVPLP
jgi:BirA family biotin operon repressor/biotin-[acetyl-CoA-carboxylase] ligase